MKTLGRLVLSAILAILASLIVAGLFLPVYGIVEGGSYNCLSDGVGTCLSEIPLSALLYGPLFSIAGLLVLTPVFMTILSWRD
ncbi:hypothetical protein [Shinella zoogloeoides]|uniref:hypothetical protein n=1 Tax=Shinella zoogloeoides TaxID=352475 RepID=UPI000E64FB6F|nr:hypothetical protein [Shinella zoogloeoides]WPE18984.1 hypothetical protein ShzoTeo12_01380 [Shinella zoogloeoides]